MSNIGMAKTEMEVDKLTAEFHKLAEENQTLYYDIPSQCAQIESNIARMEQIEIELHILQATAMQFEKLRRRSHLRVVK